jgi:cyanate lyase
MRRATTPRTSSLNQLGIFTSTNLGIIHPTAIDPEGASRAVITLDGKFLPYEPF